MTRLVRTLSVAVLLLGLGGVVELTRFGGLSSTCQQRGGPHAKNTSTLSP